VANTSGSNRITGIAWDASSDPTVVGYKIKYATIPDVGTNTTSVTVINVGNVTSYLTSGLSWGVRYYFIVTAYNSEGTESDPSNEVSELR
jgi:hypothetical protein